MAQVIPAYYIISKGFNVFLLANLGPWKYINALVVANAAKMLSPNWWACQSESFSAAPSAKWSCWSNLYLDPLTQRKWLNGTNGWFTEKNDLLKKKKTISTFLCHSPAKHTFSKSLSICFMSPCSVVLISFQCFSQPFWQKWAQVDQD